LNDTRIIYNKHLLFCLKMSGNIAARVGFIIETIRLRNWTIEQFLYEEDFDMIRKCWLVLGLVMEHWDIMLLLPWKGITGHNGYGRVVDR
jgi:hypothetical protein